MRIQLPKIDNRGLQDDLVLAISGKGTLQTMAIKTLVSRTRILLHTDSDLPKNMVKWWKEIIRETDDIVELSHWKLSLSDLEPIVKKVTEPMVVEARRNFIHFQQTPNPLYDFASKLEKIVSMINDKIVAHPKRSETIWNPQIPAKSFVVRGKNHTEISTGLMFLACPTD